MVMDYDFDQLFALRTYYEEQNGYINDEIDIIKLIKTELVDNGMSNEDANKLLQDFYKSFGITLKAEELEHIRSIQEIGNQFINSLMHGFNVANFNNPSNISTSNNETMDYVINRNLNDSNIKKCKNPNCKRNKHINVAEPKENENSENEELIAESKEDENSENEELIAESKEDENSENEELIAESKEDENYENDGDCSCEYNGEEYDNNGEEYDNNGEEYEDDNEYNNTNYQTVHFGINSLINNSSFNDTLFSSSNEINNIFSNMAMNLMSELLIQNTPTEDIICTLDDTDKENLKKIKLENDLEDKCNVCMDQMKKEEEVLILPCNHTFHTCCIEEWLTKYNYRCPICKQEVGKPKYNI